MAGKKKKGKKSRKTSAEEPKEPNPEALRWKEEGNAAFAVEDYDRATEAYRKGLEVSDDPETTATLYANRAMVFLKQERFDEAQAECSAVIDEMGLKSNAKVWYRRALARKGQAGNMDDKQATVVLQLAKLDLSNSIKALDDSPESLAMKKRVMAEAQRLQESIKERQVKKLMHPRSSSVPTPEQQRSDVVALLAARHKELPSLVEGEAFFLIAWGWWRKWCKYTAFYATDCQQILDYMPTGAMVPEDEVADDSDSDDDGDDKASNNSLSEIDNASLFLLPPDESNIFFEQWYTNYEGFTSRTALRPGLVRGYHYEILPREVYSALRSWYGEATPHVCRRTLENGRVSLYPLVDVTVSPFLCGACHAPATKLRCKRCMSVRYCDRDCQESHWPFHKIECNELDKDLEEPPELPPTTGRIGLNNVGNTCFMNSALQCLSHSAPLTRLFLSNKFQNDLNTTNPLGSGGRLAHAYDVVMKELWMRRSGSISPTALKRAISHFAPRFAGCLQHDAQEFLAYLLDGLHEDLNRIRKAPYVELPDVTEGQNMAVAGARAWDGHRRRNDSLVMDSFYGQFKSTCVCPQCSRVSVSFDAFNHVSLGIPSRKDEMISLGFTFFASGHGEPAPKPKRFGVQVRQGSQAKDLSETISEILDIHADNIVVCQVQNHQIMGLFQNNAAVADVYPLFDLCAYEVDSLSHNNVFHMIMKHCRIAMNGAKHEDFGIPVLTSFLPDLTCSETFEHIWNQVAYLVAPEDRRRLRIRFYNAQGTPLNVFPDAKARPASPNPADENSDRVPVKKTSILPSQSDELLTAYLGENAMDNFVFATLEWLDGEGENGDGPIDKESFLQCGTDESYVEAIRKQKEQAAINGAPRGVTLQQCFETFTKPERLDEQNKWFCSKCNEHVRAMKTMQLWRLPNILIVHLKRFEVKHTLRREKLDTLVDFPLEGLDMSAYCGASSDKSSLVDPKVPAVYDLFAVTNHYGRIGFGHYTAFARQWTETGISPTWTLFDDSSATFIGDDPSDIVSPSAYVLFYRRRVFN